MRNIFVNMSIGKKLAIAEFIAVVIVMAVTATAMYHYLERAIISKATENLQTESALVYSMADTYNQALNLAADRMSDIFRAQFSGDFSLDTSKTIKIGELDTPTITLNGETLNLNFASIDRFTEASKAVATIFVRKDDDFARVATSLKKEDGTTRAIGTLLGKTHPGYEKLAKGEEYLGIARLFGRDYVTKYVPVKDKGGQIVGVLFIGLDFTEGFKALREKIKATKIGQTGYIYVVDAKPGKTQGDAVVHPNQEGKNKLTEKDESTGKEYIKEMIQTGEGTMEYTRVDAEKNVHEVVAAYKVFKNWNWLLVVRTTKGELRETVRLLRLYLVIGGGLATAALIALLLFTTERWISVPLGKAVEYANHMAKGNLAFRVSHADNDEIGMLITSINNVGEHLRDMVSDLRTTTDSMVGETAELTTSAEQIMSGMSEQTNRASVIASSSEEMASTVLDIAQNVGDIAESARETTEIAKSGETIVENSVREVQLIASAVGESSESMRFLAQRSQQINEIVDVINDIADQTNLLALNAAIEAASAGEHGRGFAVVADEVRQLAKRTASATSEIGKMIKDIQDDVKKSVTSMDKATKNVEVGVQYSNQAGDALRQIVGSVERLNEKINQIASASEQMSSVADMISKDIASIVAVSRQTEIKVSVLGKIAAAFTERRDKFNAFINQFRI